MGKMENKRVRPKTAPGQPPISSTIEDEGRDAVVPPIGLKPSFNPIQVHSPVVEWNEQQFRNFEQVLSHSFAGFSYKGEPLHVDDDQSFLSHSSTAAEKFSTPETVVSVQVASALEIKDRLSRRPSTQGNSMNPIGKSQKPLARSVSAKEFSVLQTGNRPFTAANAKYPKSSTNSKIRHDRMYRIFMDALLTAGVPQEEAEAKVKAAQEGNLDDESIPQVTWMPRHLLKDRHYYHNKHDNLWCNPWLVPPHRLNFTHSRKSNDEAVLAIEQRITSLQAQEANRRKEKQKKHDLILARFRMQRAFNLEKEKRIVYKFNRGLIAPKKAVPPRSPLAKRQYQHVKSLARPKSRMNRYDLARGAYDFPEYKGLIVEKDFFQPSPSFKDIPFPKELLVNPTDPAQDSIQYHVVPQKIDQTQLARSISEKKMARSMSRKNVKEMHKDLEDFDIRFKLLAKSMEQNELAK